MLDVQIDEAGFDAFEGKLGRMINGGFIEPGFKKAVEHVREVVIDGTPVGDPETDEHPGLMKKSWQQPKYEVGSGYRKATIKNSVDYGMASNYGHWQEPGRYVPAIEKRLVHAWIPGTYALERSLDQAGFQIEPIIREELLKTWYDVDFDRDTTVRQEFYDFPTTELNEGADYYAEPILE